MSRRSLPAWPVAVLAAAGLVAAGAAARPTGIAVAVYPSATSLTASGALPAGGASTVSLNVPIASQDDALVVVGGAHQVALQAPASVGPLPLKLMFAHYVDFGGALRPDALLPWDGSPRPAERRNQPLWVQITVPAGTAPGTYSDRLVVTTDGQQKTIPISVHVFDVTLPPANRPDGNVIAAFHLSAETYVNTVGRLNGFTRSEQYRAVNPSLFAFLAQYRISPLSWGYGEPRTPTGYAHDSRWWRDSLGNMTAEVGGGAFPALRLPISNNRTAPHNYIAGLSPADPQGWCPYLKSVHEFWQQQNWLGAFPFLYGQDEPGAAGFRLVGRQAAALHACFPGGKLLVTGNPVPTNRYLWDGRGGDDVDTWAVLAPRYYGEWTAPTRPSRAREKFASIQAARAHGARIWTYTYPKASPGVPTPGFTASEQLSNSRMLFLWAALEQIGGVLYAEGTTNYVGDPLQAVGKDGAFVLLYPSLAGPIPSARLEQIRNGIEDWALYRQVALRYGPARLRELLGAASGLFSADRSGVELGCSVGCRLRSTSPDAWPRYSHDASTPARIERAKLLALQLLDGR
jgi:hypothetical protein